MLLMKQEQLLLYYICSSEVLNIWNGRKMRVHFPCCPSMLSPWLRPWEVMLFDERTGHQVQCYEAAFYYIYCLYYHILGYFSLFFTTSFCFFLHPCSGNPPLGPPRRQSTRRGSVPTSPKKLSTQQYRNTLTINSRAPAMTRLLSSKLWRFWVLFHLTAYRRYRLAVIWGGFSRPFGWCHKRMVTIISSCRASLLHWHI